MPRRWSQLAPNARAGRAELKPTPRLRDRCRGRVMLPLPDDAERTLLAGDDWIYQRKRGHRTSTDDVVTAACAVRAVQATAGLAPGAVARYADIGCGIGSVLLLTARTLRPAYAVGVEAQAESVALLSATLAELPPDRRPTIVHGDLRAATAEAMGTFDLVTGSPPYFPLGTGVEPSDAQRRACRFEVRGGVEAYLACAARLLSPHGRFVMVAQTSLDARVRAGAANAGLSMWSRVDFWMREDRPDPFLTVYEVGREPRTVTNDRVAVRTASGSITPAYKALRATLGLTTRD